MFYSGVHIAEAILDKEYFQKLAAWFNGKVDENFALNTQVCKNIADAWLKRFQDKDSDCNKCN
jgi:hypothetical protein